MGNKIIPYPTQGCFDVHNKLDILKTENWISKNKIPNPIIIKNKITLVEQLKEFNVDGYSYNSAMSEGNQWAFCRPES